MPFSTRQLPGWLGCVFHPARSFPLNKGANALSSRSTLLDASSGDQSLGLAVPCLYGRGMPAPYPFSCGVSPVLTVDQRCHDATVRPITTTEAAVSVAPGRSHLVDSAAYLGRRGGDRLFWPRSVLTDSAINSKCRSTGGVKASSQWVLPRANSIAPSGGRPRSGSAGRPSPG